MRGMWIGTFWIVCAFLFARLFLGCTSHSPAAVDSKTQPQPISQNDIRWVAQEMAGNNQRWFWVPEQVALFNEHVDWSKDLPVDILVQGDTWHLRQDESGKYLYPSPNRGSTTTRLLTILLFFGALIFCINTTMLTGDLKSAQSEVATAMELADTHKQYETQLTASHDALVRDLNAAYTRRQQELENASRLALAKTMQTLRKEADERYRVTVTAADLADRDQRLREAQLMFSRNGRLICVRGFSTPTGWVALEWSLPPSLPEPLNVIGIRDGKVVFTEFAYRGMFSDLLEPGLEYTFQMRVVDGKVDREDNFRFVVRLPTEEEWRRRIGGEDPISAAEAHKKRINEKIETITEADALWEKARRVGHGRVEQSDGTEFEKKKRKARLDAKLEEERDKEDGSAQ